MPSEEARELEAANTTEWVVPAWCEPPAAGERPSSCRSCGASVMWLTTKRGKKAPVNPDGTSHFATCPQAASWRRSNAPQA